MKILLMTDMEGVAGVLDRKQWVLPEGRYYDHGKRLLTMEANAAVEGFFEAGATEVVVIDGHGSGGIDPELLDERAWLVRGHFHPVWPWGLDRTCAGFACVGQHAKAGTAYSHITHTQSHQMIDLAVNGVSIGEYGQLALCAAELGVPAVFACGEQAFAEEAAALTPGVVTVAVKRGLLPDGLDHLSTEEYADAKLGAMHMSPRRARKFIRAGAAEAVRQLRTQPETFRHTRLNPPYVRTARFRSRGTRPPFETRDEHPDSIIALMNMPFTPPDLPDTQKP